MRRTKRPNSRLWIVLIAIIVYALMMAGCSQGTSPDLPDAPVLEQEYRPDQLVQMEGTFVMDGPDLMFQTAGEGGSGVGYFLDQERYATPNMFLKYTWSDRPVVTIRGYRLSSGKLAVCMVEDVFAHKPLRLNNCPPQ
ncbi:MAG: hypothetical protein UZ22_OP11002000169 [Microgenomates bacterium OLB23]|nr:MAG: hypothetical protein UZ22_OP11002000169 [Microgenomates bacterium OLB23]